MKVLYCALIQEDENFIENVCWAYSPLFGLIISTVMYTEIWRICLLFQNFVSFRLRENYTLILVYVEPVKQDVCIELP